MDVLDAVPRVDEAESAGAGGVVELPGVARVGESFVLLLGVEITGVRPCIQNIRTVSGINIDLPKRTPSGMVSPLLMTPSPAPLMKDRSTSSLKSEKFLQAGGC